MRNFFCNRGARVAAMCALAALTVIASVGCSPEPPRPNLVLISLDTLRADHLGVYGYERDTSPNLDAWARRGVVFRDHYSQAPNTAPSHTSILTGLFPSVAGVWNHGAVLDPNVPVLAELLKENGYATAAFVQLPGESYKRGFDIYSSLSHDASMRREANADIDAVYDFVSTEREDPFFLFLHTYAVHLAYNPPQEFADKFWGDYDGDLGRVIRVETADEINDGTREASEADLQHVVDMYDAEIAALDSDLGEIFEFFESQGLLENTVFAIISDHGEEFGEHGVIAQHTYSLHQQLIKTPLIMFGGSVPAGVEVELPSRNVDVAPTFLELAFSEIPTRMQGFDLAPLWTGTESEPRVILAEKEDYRTFIVDGFKYYTDSGDLFDINEDPLERNDLRDQRPDKVIEFERLIAGWEAELEYARSTVSEAGEVRLTPDEIRRLKALGYLR